MDVSMHPTVNPMSKLESIPCPLCDNTREFLPIDILDDDEVIQTYGDLYKGHLKSKWQICGQCGFVHQNPRPSIRALNEYYLEAQYHQDPQQYDLKMLSKLYRGCYRHDLKFAIEKSGISKGTVFDIGCGLGFAVYEFNKLGWTAIGIEPDPRRAEFARQKLGLNIQQGVLNSDISIQSSVDLVFSHHAWEHIADFKEVMDGILKIIRKGGYFYASMPTYFQNRSSMSKIYLNSGHYSSFTHRSLSQLLARYGFEYVAHQYYNDFGISVTDDIMFLAQYTGKIIDPTMYYEDPFAVRHYLNFTNPVRTILFSPIYSVKYRQIGIFGRLMRDAFKIAFTQPTLFLKKVRARLKI
jgi:SAM-dependent methyltransferase